MTQQASKKGQVHKVQVWVIAPGEKILLLRLVPSRGGFWQPITGGVEEGESLEHAARRELFEESGYTLDQGTLQDVGFSFEYEGKWGFTHESVFRFDLRGAHPPAPRLDASEHDHYEWVSGEEAEMRIPHAHVREALSQVLAIRRSIKR